MSKKSKSTVGEEVEAVEQKLEMVAPELEEDAKEPELVEEQIAEAAEETTAVENNFEVVSEAISETDFTEAVFMEEDAGSAEGDFAGSSTEVEGIYSQAGTQENEEDKTTEKKPKKKITVKDVFVFAQTYIFVPKVCSFILITLGIVLTLLCGFQMVEWGFSVKETYLEYWKAIKTLDYINIAVMVFMLLFVIVLAVSIVRSVISLIKKGHEANFEMISTMFAFYLFSLFVTKLFAGKVLLISNFKFSSVLESMTGLLIGYTLVRLFVRDFASRIVPFIFSCGAIVLAVMMFTQNIGQFAEYTICGSLEFGLSDLNLYKYICSSFGITKNVNLLGELETMFLEYGANIDIKVVVIEEKMLIVFLQLIPIVVASILPYAALSLLGYLVYGLVGKNYMQYYSLQSCKKVSVTMLVASLFSIAATVGLMFLCKFTKSDLEVSIDYTNAITTVVLCIAMIVVTSLPWKMYSVVYKHRYSVHQKKEGGN